MRQTQRVLWTKGVLLTPQHLQTQDRFLEELVRFRLSSLTFCPWGFSRLEVDRDALAGGVLTVSSAAGLFPDGLPFDIPESDPAPAPLPLEGRWAPDQTALDVHLAIPEHRTAGHNVSTGSGNGGTRYVAEVVYRRDENTGLSEKPIQVARKNLRLVAGREPLEGSFALPIARVIRAPSGSFELDGRFVAPMVDIAASDLLMAIARRLVEILSGRSGSLGGARRQRNQSLADFGVADVANFWLLYTINTHLPVIRHLFETRRGHPAALFEAMIALAGSLMTFSSTHHPRDLPAYDHADLSACFTKLDEIVRELLETVVPANHVALPLRVTEPSIHATAIDQDRYLETPQLYLAISAEMRPDELLAKTHLLKVSSGSGVGRLIKQALPGVGLRHVATPPSSLPVKLNYQYFQVDRSGADWDAIKLQRNLAVYVPSDFPDPRLELVVMLPK